MGAANAESYSVKERCFRLALREDIERFLRLAAVYAGTLDRFFDSVMPAHQRDRARKIALLNVAVLKGAPPEGALLRAAAAVRQHDRQRDFAFAEIVADAFAEHRGLARIVERVIDELEGETDIFAIDAE